MLFACSCQHMLNTFPFIQRTEQVLIELDISAIEEYVIIIIIIYLKQHTGPLGVDTHQYLTNIYNAAINNYKKPHVWKLANIIPIRWKRRLAGLL